VGTQTEVAVYVGETLDLDLPRKDLQQVLLAGFGASYRIPASCLMQTYAMLHPKDSGPHNYSL